jgi:hypothetical protein
MTSYLLGIGVGWLLIGTLVALRVGMTLSIKKKPSWPGWLVAVATLAGGIFWPVPVVIYSYVGGQDRGWW